MKFQEACTFTINRPYTRERIMQREKLNNIAINKISERLVVGENKDNEESRGDDDQSN